MSDHYTGEIKCPYCKELTEFWCEEYASDYCNKCGKEFIIEVDIKARKLK